MNIKKATAKYEAWLARHLRIVDPDLKFKHAQMRTAVFPFMRATYYRWAQVWEDVCGDAARGLKVLAVGDLHVENFGTWRDIEGRLIWGINDFDEAWRLPYTNDLIRLAASALLAEMGCDAKAGMDAILKGYGAALEAGGRPFVLAEHHPALRHMATARLHDPEPYWQKLRALAQSEKQCPAGVSKALDRMMPERGLRWREAHGNGTWHWLSGAADRWRAKPRHWRRRLACGRQMEKARRPFCTRRFWIARCDAAIRSCGYRGAGSSGGWRRIARGLNYPRYPRSTTCCGC